MTAKHYKSGSAFPPLMPKVIRLYSMRYCPYAERARLVLAHKNIPYETINIHLKEKPDWFLEKNPQGTVPVLEIDDKIVYESTAVCEFLDDIQTTNRLQPSDPYRKAWDRILLEYFSKVSSTLYTLILKTEEVDKVADELAKHYKFYEAILVKRGGPFFGDDNPSMIDFYLWPQFERIQALGTRAKRILVDRASYPKLAEWLEAINKVPAVQATATDTSTLIHFLDTVSTGKPDYDYGLD